MIGLQMNGQRRERKESMVTRKRLRWRKGRTRGRFFFFFDLVSLGGGGESWRFLLFRCVTGRLWKGRKKAKSSGSGQQNKSMEVKMGKQGK